MDPVAIATGLVTDNSAVALALVTGLFAVTLVPTLAVIGVKRAKGAIVSFANGGARK